MVSILDYGIGNLGSIINMFKWIGVDANIISTADEIKGANKILLPGVGSFDRAMQRIHELNIKEVLDTKALEDKIPFLGICLGMQLLTDSSEEGSIPGLGWIPGKTVKFKPEDSNLKVPHMGWNLVQKYVNHQLIDDLGEDARFYFVHSYYVKVSDNSNKLLETAYGDITFDSAIVHNNIYGAQFHPEKSHKFGMKLLKNFARL